MSYIDFVKDYTVTLVNLASVRLPHTAQPAGDPSPVLKGTQPQNSRWSFLPHFLWIGELKSKHWAPAPVQCTILICSAVLSPHKMFIEHRETDRHTHTQTNTQRQKNTKREREMSYLWTGFLIRQHTLNVFAHLFKVRVLAWSRFLISGQNFFWAQHPVHVHSKFNRAQHPVHVHSKFNT